MDLILWRHADADYAASSDLVRELTPKGRKQAKRMAAWLKLHLKGKKPLRLIASEAKRSQQTLAAFSDDYTIDSRLNPDASSAADYLTACDWPGNEGEFVVIVGHQPDIGHTASLLLTGREVECGVKKGAIWWLQYRVHDGEAQCLLRAMITPQMLENQ